MLRSMHGWRAPARVGPALDFMAGRPQPPAVAWWLLGCGLLVAGLCGADFWGAQQALLAAQTAQAEQRAQTPRRSFAATHLSAGGAATAAADAVSTGRDAASLATGRDVAKQSAGRDAAWAVSQALAHPWPRIFEAMDAVAPAGVRWLALEHDSTRTELRLQGMARSAAAALTLVDTLARQPLLTVVVMTRLDPADSDAAAPGVRFEISAEPALSRPIGPTPRSAAATPPTGTALR